MDIRNNCYNNVYSQFNEDNYSDLNGVIISTFPSVCGNYHATIDHDFSLIIPNKSPIEAYICLINESLLFVNYGEYSDNIQNYNSESIVEDKDESKEIVSYSDILLASKQFLGLNISTISTILDISRPTVYSYLKGNAAADSSNFNKIKKLNKILKIVIEENKLHAFPSLFKYRDIEGKTLVDYFIQDLPDMDIFVKSLCISEIERRKNIKKNNNKPKRDMEAFCIPIFFEG